MATLLEVRTPKYPTAQSIIDSASQDSRKLLSNSGSDASILLDYVNRVCLFVLRVAKWEFLRAPAQQFITAMGQTDYWIGSVGQGPITATDTLLNLPDFDRIEQTSVFDRSNFRQLGLTRVELNNAGFSQRDSSQRMEKPRLFRNDPNTPFILNLYPAPDNQNSYQPQPSALVAQTVLGGSLPLRTYYLRGTFVDSSLGESAASNGETIITIPANYLLQVLPPQPGIGHSGTGVLYNQYKVYASTIQGGEVLQTASPIATSATWTEPTSGLVTNTVAFPTTSTIATVNGYVIEFQYYRQRLQVVSFNQPLQIPLDYKGVLVSGVNMYVANYLKKAPEAQMWATMFQSGIRDMIRDLNLFGKEENFIKPDGNMGDPVQGMSSNSIWT